MRTLAINDGLKIQEVIFYFDEEYQCVIAYFTSGGFYLGDGARKLWVNAFVLEDGFVQCNSAYIEHFKPASKAQYQQTYNELTENLGFILSIAD